MGHLDDWLVARRERIRREREEAEQRVRAQIEAKLQEARRRRLEEEEAIQAARARWDEARRIEKRISIQLELVQGRGNAPNPPGPVPGLTCERLASARELTLTQKPEGRPPA